MENQIDVEGLRLVRRLTESKDFVSLQAYGLTTDCLVGAAKILYERCQEHFLKYGVYPTAESLENSYGIQLEKQTGPIEPCLDILQNRVRTTSAVALLEEAHRCIERGDPKLAWDIIQGGSDGLTNPQGAKSYTKDIESRLNHYTNLKTGKTIAAYPTPWPELNKSISGFRPGGDLALFTARYGMGKSWHLCLLADHYFRLGLNVAFFSLEMTEADMARRMDVTRHKLPFAKFKKGKLDPKDEARWVQGLQVDLKATNDIKIYDQVFTISEAQAIVMTTSPHIVLVDGAYRFQIPGKDGWAQTLAITQQLQDAVKYTKRPWVLTTQYGNSETTSTKLVAKKPGEPLNPDQIRYGREWAMAADIIYGSYQNESQRAANIMELHVMKARDADEDMGEPVFDINWDTANMDFTEISKTSTSAGKIQLSL